MGIIYTIGTSIHTIDYFLLILEKYNINAVADVRSIPYSKHTPQYNRETMIKYFEEKEVCYFDFTKEFGAKRNELKAYTNNIIDYRKVVNLPNFLHGIERIKECVNKGYNIAILCTEKNPVNCHRFYMVSKSLNEVLKINIEHILFDGSLINHKALEKEMLSMFNLENELFNDSKYLLEIANDKISKKHTLLNKCTL